VSEVEEVESAGGNIQQVRDAILRRLQRQHGNPTIVRMAEGRLRQRLPLWTGEAVARPEPNVSDALTTGSWAEGATGADLAERLIVRTLAGTRDAAPFSVDAEGVLFSADAADLAPEPGVRVALGGLSPLLDTAAAMFFELSNRRGGRFGYAQDNTFVAANGAAVFLRVSDGSAVFEVVQHGGVNPILHAPVVSKPASRTASKPAAKTPRPAARKVAERPPAAVCPTCFQEMPRTGICDNCE